MDHTGKNAPESNESRAIDHHLIGFLAADQTNTINRTVSLLTSTTYTALLSALSAEDIQPRVVRSACLECDVYTPSMVDNVFGRLNHEAREVAIQRCEDILGDFLARLFGRSQWDGTTRRTRRAM
ncbi:hypothetical protein P691DRAFT_780190 [Macrolepiota fuliginosa MF-IS2]|uniref:Uncharacterized protein n=1 Tax=Macrolepiota fuliginosa MF-IS2 TaxID=1400762 RepID=A0A9P6BUE9_9AGAR|nr:hypothetical protein P691DRAFT_780190 [Macrolepiota fuliginosa MF-IS2]